MKRSVLIFIFTTIIQMAYSQVSTRFFAKGEALSQVKLFRGHEKSNKLLKLPSFDVQKFINEDNQNVSKDIPFRFGKSFDTKISFSDGEWVEVNEGRIWSMEFQSKGAFSINFVFDDFYLSDSSKLYISNSEGTMLYGPVTSKENTENGYFLTDLIIGENITVYLYEPNSEKGKSRLTIKKVVHAYYNLYPDLYGKVGSSLSCNNNIVCFPEWDLESDAIALVLLSTGDEICSGSLLMNTAKDFKPYFLSAFHCVDLNVNGILDASEITNASNWLFKFQYKMTTCVGNTPTTGITYNRAAFRAAWQTSDFVLMEMNYSPVGNDQLSWLGWDRSTNIPSLGRTIHHPKGDVMKISFDNHVLYANPSPITWTGGIISPPLTHWSVNFTLTSDGTTESGSSGAPLFDQNRRVVGQLHGGLDGCPPITKQFGRFNLSWNGGGTSSTRLSTWLDPCNSGTTELNTLRSPYISGSSTPVCSSGVTFTLNNLPSGYSINWAYSSNLQMMSSSANFIVLKAIGNGSGYVQATLNSSCGTINIPQFPVLVGTQIPGSVSIVMDAPIHRFTAVLDDDVPTATSYNWYLDGVLQSNHTSSVICNRRSPYCGNSYLLQVESINPCGISAKKNTTVIEPQCGEGLLLLSPNPASDFTEVSIIEDSTTVSTNINDINKINSRYNVNISDVYGKIVFQTNTTLNKFIIPIGNLKNGIYVIKILSDNNSWQNTLIINH